MLRQQADHTIFPAGIAAIGAGRPDANPRRWLSSIYGDAAVERVGDQMEAPRSHTDADRAECHYKRIARPTRQVGAGSIP